MVKCYFGYHIKILLLALALALMGCGRINDNQAPEIVNKGQDKIEDSAINGFVASAQFNIENATTLLLNNAIIKNRGQVIGYSLIDDGSVAIVFVDMQGATLQAGHLVFKYYFQRLIDLKNSTSWHLFHREQNNDYSAGLWRGKI